MSSNRIEKDGVNGVGRRTFNKVAIGAGAALALDPAMGCSPSKRGVRTEVKTLHFDLAGHPDGSVHVVKVLGKRYPLVAHTVESLQQAVADNPHWADDRLTHYAEGVELSAEKPHMFSVTTQHPDRGPGLLMVALHIPSAAREAVAAKVGPERSARLRTLSTGPCARADAVDCPMDNDQIPDEFHNAFDTAKAIVMHHPEIANLNPEIAAAVEVHLCESGEVANLAFSICDQGPAYERDDVHQDGWCVLVPMKNDDGSPKINSKGEPVFEYRFSERTSADLKPAVRDVLGRIKNDRALKDKMYAVRTHDTSDDGGPAASLAARARLWNSNGVQLTATQTGYHHNVWFKSPRYTGDGATRSFSIDIVNMNFIWYCLYVEYLDAAGKPLEVHALGSMLGGRDAEVVRQLQGLESTTVKWENVISSPPTVFGVPLLPYPTHLDVTLPEGACSARIMLCGPGAWGSVDYAPSLALGTVLTGLMQYGLPSYFLYSGKGIDEDASLWDAFTTKPMLLKLTLAVYNLLEMGIHMDDTHGAALVGSIERLLAGMLENMIVLLANKSLPYFAEWVAEKSAEEEAEDAIPFVGWVLRILTVTGTVADMLATTAEIARNPMTIDDVVTFTAPVDVLVTCDPGNGQFPEEANWFEVQFTVTGAAYPSKPMGFVLDAATRGNRTMKVTVDGVPTTWRNDDLVDVWFYSDQNKGWLAGHGRATFVNRTADGGGVTAMVTIEENVIPLSATTVYSQHRKLEYRTATGSYVWNEDPATLQDPVIEPASCDGAKLCELTNISVWVPGNMVGYSWEVGSQHLVKNVSGNEGDPNTGMKLLSSGVGAPTPVAYDKTAPFGSAQGNHFYLDPVDLSVDHPAYHLRKLTLDASGVFKASGSWGRFPMQLDRLAVHPFGYVVGLSTNNHKMGILKLPAEPYADDAHTNNAVIKLGYGETDAFVKRPQAMTIGRTGAILILEGEDAITLKAFDWDGNPWAFFKGETASSFPLVEEDAKWLDIAIDDTEMIYILSYTGTGALKSDYRLDVYNRNGEHVLRNTGIAVARMIVDKWRRVFTLNQEVMKDSPIVEPTVSVWLPSLPT